MIKLRKNEKEALMDLLQLKYFADAAVCENFSETAKGKSLPFLLLVFFGYIAGIISKFTNVTYMENFASKWYVLVFYCINLVMVGIDTVLYFRNLALDKQRDANN